MDDRPSPHMERASMDFFTPPSQPDPKLLHVRLQGQQRRAPALTTAIASACPGRRRPETCWDRDSQLLVVVGPDGTVRAGWNHPEAAGRFIKCQRVRRRRILSGIFPLIRKGVWKTWPSITSDASTPSCSRGRRRFLPIAEMSYSIGVPLLCTANVFDPNQHYPLQVPDSRTGTPVPSPSIPVTAAGGGDVWLFGLMAV